MESVPAEDLLIRSLQRRTTPEEDEHLRAWRESTPENDREYRRLAELWALVGRFSAQPADAAPRPLPAPERRAHRRHIRGSRHPPRGDGRR